MTVRTSSRFDLFLRVIWRLVEGGVFVVLIAKDHRVPQWHSGAHELRRFSDSSPEREPVGAISTSAVV